MDASNGTMATSGAPSVVKETPATALVDGNNVLGKTQNHIHFTAPFFDFTKSSFISVSFSLKYYVNYSNIVSISNIIVLHVHVALLTTLIKCIPNYNKIIDSLSRRLILH